MTIPPVYTKLTCPQCGAGVPSADASIICQYCGTRLILTQPRVSSTGNSSVQPEFIQGMRLTTHIGIDSQGTGSEAFRMLIPAGWQVRGGVVWQPTNPGIPATFALQVWNPSGPEAFEAFPVLPFYWSNNPLTSMLKPTGSIYFGNEVRAPLPVVQAMRQITLPRFRNISNLQIIREEAKPGLVQQLNAATSYPPDPNAHMEGGSIRIRYPGNSGFVFEEDIFGVITMMKIPSPSMLGGSEMVFWQLNYQYAFRAAAGKLDQLLDLLRLMVTSFKINPQWYAHVAQLSQYLIRNQIQQIHNIGQLSRQISQNFNEISDSNLQSYYANQAVMDRLAENFSQTIRGVDAYTDPNTGNQIELPGGYTQAWSTPLGEFIVSNDPFFNPNIETNQSWTPLNKKS